MSSAPALATNKHGYPAHCYHAKGQERLDVVHPYQAPVLRFVRLRGTTGELELEDEAARRDVDVALNLNARRLQSLRRSALKAALADLQQSKRRESWAPQRLARTLAELQRRTTPLDYQPLLEDWLQRHLGRSS